MIHKQFNVPVHGRGRGREGRSGKQEQRRRGKQRKARTKEEGKTRTKEERKANKGGYKVRGNHIIKF